MKTYSSFIVNSLHGLHIEVWPFLISELFCINIYKHFYYLIIEHEFVKIKIFGMFVTFCLICPFMICVLQCYCSFVRKFNAPFCIIMMNFLFILTLPVADNFVLERLQPIISLADISPFCMRKIK